MDLKQFLFESKANLEKGGELKICLSNMSCDLNSLCSTLVFSYSRNLIPVINMSQYVFLNKKENVFVCEELGITCDDLIFINGECFEFKACEITKTIKIDGEKILLYLVSESEPSRLFQDSKLKLIADINELSKSFNKDIEVYIETNVKSCSSLISRITQVSKEIKKALFYSILFDTDNLNISTEIDREQFKSICLENNFSEEYRLEILALLKKLRKENEAEQTDFILLRKDYREFGNFGLSSVRYGLLKWIYRNGLEYFRNEVKTFMDIQQIEYLFINFNCKFNGERKRFLVIFPQDFIHVDKLFDFIPRKEIKKYEDLIYYGLNPDFSRKNIVPALRKFFDSTI
ncbi:unnamed protein product [Brachionus calyciflorus]|uniref:Uncharacterized protein n=1 Tax=Brachionus calyciflorus TaxID=104777 RepID=A0A813YIQ3_9BILA|nr:unnamed protein product [Brachionus calyciflorus]